ncbi:MAG TPA: GTPase ObgE [Gemmatimonadetes bacterium]|nr:GTPase ObgE [Gemmatimonadota bacterium]
MMFVDRVVINVYAGPGGAGSEAYRREKGVPRGGPAGGDGGRGGSVVMVADAQLSTLLDLRYRQHHRAERGFHGAGKNKTGRGGADLIVPVPPGTIIKDADTEVVLGELLEPGDQIVVAQGGRGGRGNVHFTTSTNQTPLRWESGGAGEERRVEVELKLMADVGLVGEPNAGKSTFLAAVSKATPKVADYPFTTLAPNLGIVELADFRSFAVADIPGIVEGAHEGKGLGLQFLRHIERTRTLAVMIPVDAPDPALVYQELRQELSSYSEELGARPHCVVLTKIDLLAPEEDPPAVDAPEAWGIFSVSSATRKGVSDLLEALWKRVREVIKEESVAPEDVGWEIP